MNYIPKKLRYKFIVTGTMALAFLFIQMGMEGWATITNQPASDSYITTAPNTLSTKECTAEDPCLPEGYPKESEPEEMVTILNPAAQSTLSEKTTSVRSIGVGNSKKFGLALIILSALAEENS